MNDTVVSLACAKNKPQSSDGRPFRKGQEVALNSGGEWMTVRNCRKDKDGWYVSVNWHDSAGCLEEHEFPVEMVYLRPDEAGEAAADSEAPEPA